MESFEFINSTYWHIFHYSYFNVFLDEEPIGNRIRWKLKRVLAYFVAFIYFPIWILLQGSGIIWGSSADSVQIGYEISHLIHIIELEIKILFFLYFVKDMRKLCIKFEYFNVSIHRPIHTRKILTNTSIYIRQLSKDIYKLVLANITSWCLGPLTVQPIAYLLFKKGFIKKNIPSIPVFLKTRFIFPERLGYKILAASLECFVLFFGFLFFISIDQFFLCVILMISGQVEVICKSIQTEDDLIFSKKIIPDEYALDEKDNKDGIDIKYFIQDHQKILEITRKLRKIMSPIIAVITQGIMITTCTLLISIVTSLKENSPLMVLLGQIASRVVVTTFITIKLYLYGWMCGLLKDAEESIFHAIYYSKWYEQPKSYKDAALLIMQRSMKAKKVQMFGIGDMDRETFIQGLKSIYSLYNFLLNN